jgi:hypothetical protein
MNLIEQFRGSIINRWLLIVTAVVLLASISSAAVAFSFPTEIEESFELISYQHEGEFSYIAYLKPSYLFGPEPQEPPPLPPPPTPKYPTEIIESIEMTFSYTPAEEISAEVEVKAILENPNLWQKEITLVPAATKTGDFTIVFPLDISELNQLFDTIDEEIKITSSNRQVTIVATVLTEGDVFIQSLPINLGQTVIEVDSNLQLTQAGATGEFDYSVHLKENTLFDTATLKSPPVIPPSPSPPPPPLKTVGTGELLFSNLTDKMDITFSYSLKSDKPVSQVAEEVEIRAVVENPEMWSKTFILMPRTSQSGDFTVTVTLDINQMLEILQTIRSEAGVSAPSHNLTVTADVYTTAQTEFGPIVEVFSQTMSTTLGEGTLDWSEELISSKPGSIETSRMIPKKFLGLSVSAARILFPVLASIFLALSMGLLMLYVKYGPARLPKIEREALRAKKRYRDLIVDVKELPATVANEMVIALGSLDDLITTAEELGKVVLHKAETEKHTYCVVDATIIYQYVSGFLAPGREKTLGQQIEEMIIKETERRQRGKEDSNG